VRDVHDTAGYSAASESPASDPYRPAASHEAQQVAQLAAAVSHPEPPDAPKPTRLIALINQKGGVGKTTTTVNLGAGLVRQGYRVLMIDLDPQAHMTLHLGLDPQQLELTVYDLLSDDGVSPFQVAQELSDSMVVLPADVNLAGLESELAEAARTGQAQRLLSRRCASILTNYGFDFVLLDCPPSLGLLTVNALALAREVVVPMQAHFLALQGLSQLLETVSLVRQSINPELVVSGIALCMHEANTVLAQDVHADLSGFLAQARDSDMPWANARVMSPPIRRNIKLAEAPSYGQSIFDYAPNCPGSRDYDALCRCLAEQTGPAASHRTAAPARASA